MDVAIFAVHGITAPAHEHSMDLAGSLAGAADGHLSARAARHSPASLLAGHLSSPHDCGPVGFDGSSGHLAIVVCRQLSAVGGGAIWCGAISQLAIGLRRLRVEGRESLSFGKAPTSIAAEAIGGDVGRDRDVMRPI